jgi:hypothetical protein
VLATKLQTMHTLADMALLRMTEKETAQGKGTRKHPKVRRSLADLIDDYHEEFSDTPFSQAGIGLQGMASKRFIAVQDELARHRVQEAEEKRKQNAAAAKELEEFQFQKKVKEEAVDRLENKKHAAVMRQNEEEEKWQRIQVRTIILYYICQAIY